MNYIVDTHTDDNGSISINDDALALTMTAETFKNDYRADFEIQIAQILESEEMVRLAVAIALFDESLKSRILDELDKVSVANLKEDIVNVINSYDPDDKCDITEFKIKREAL